MPGLGPRVWDGKFLLHPRTADEYHRIFVDFEIANEDTSGTVQYFGWVSSWGSWIIQKRDTSGTGVVYTYAAGKALATYSGNWNASGVYIGTLVFYGFDQLTANLL
jgi:hypothetical protein